VPQNTPWFPPTRTAFAQSRYRTAAAAGRVWDNFLSVPPPTSARFPHSLHGGNLVPSGQLWGRFGAYSDPDRPAWSPTAGSGQHTPSWRRARDNRTMSCCSALLSDPAILSRLKQTGAVTVAVNGSARRPYPAGAGGSTHAFPRSNRSPTTFPRKSGIQTARPCTAETPHGSRATRSSPGCRSNDRGCPPNALRPSPHPADAGDRPTSTTE